jgi:hypothetical protein
MLMGALSGFLGSLFPFPISMAIKSLLNTVFEKFAGGAFGKIADVIMSIVGIFTGIWDNAKEAWAKIKSIWSGEGSIFSKIGKTIWALFEMVIKNWKLIFVNVGKAIWSWFTGLMEIVYKLPIMLVTWILEKLGWVEEGTTEAVSKLWDWITGGGLLGKLVELGSWLYEWITTRVQEAWDKITGKVKEEVETTAEAAKLLATNPAAALSGGMDLPSSVGTGYKWGKPNPPEGSEESTSTTSTTPSIAKSIDTPVPLPSFLYGNTVAARTVMQGVAAASEARINATTSTAAGTAINAPTTNVVNGGGQPTLIMPPVSRNTDPTMRALAFSESPAL